MWGWISGNTIGELVEIPTRMNSAEYICILENSFLPSVRAIYPKRSTSYPIGAG
jgi:hypothetical protein